eukprot:6800024-Ditylum_brightwellii.AAC.1
MEMTDVETVTMELNTPVPSDEELWNDDKNDSTWNKETVVLDDLVVALLNAMENDPSFFIGKILLRFFTPQENIITTQAV